MGYRLGSQFMLFSRLFLFSTTHRIIVVIMITIDVYFAYLLF